jgi:hypothetical protein
MNARPKRRSKARRSPLGAARGELQADVATLHAVARVEFMGALVADPRVVSVFGALADCVEPDATERRLAELLDELALPAWPWLPRELDLAARAWSIGAACAGGTPRGDWWRARRAGIPIEAAAEAPLRAVPQLPPLPDFDAGMGETEALSVLEHWYAHARVAICKVADRRPPGRKPTQASVEGVREATRWLARRLLVDEPILAIAATDLDPETSAACPEDRRSWIRSGMRRAEELLATDPFGTLLASACSGDRESKEPVFDVFALPSGPASRGSGSAE